MALHLGRQITEHFAESDLLLRIQYYLVIDGDF